MICEMCKKKDATIFIKEVVLGKTKTYALCDDCMKKHKETMIPSNIQIDKLIQSLISFADEETKKINKKEKITKKQKTKRCENCLSTYDEVILAASPGCEECYKYFENEIMNILKKVSNEKIHVGKMPSKKNTSEELNDKDELIRKYKLELNDAISCEDFEKAAKLRDEIRKLNEVEINKKNAKPKKKGKKDDNSL